MVDFEKQIEQLGKQYEGGRLQIANTFVLVYGWMSAGLALSGLVAWYTFTSGLWKLIFLGPGFVICLIAEFLLVFALSGLIRKIPVALAYCFFVVYAALNGLSMSVVFIVYEIGTVQRVFFITAATFGGLSLYGTFSKSDLSSIGSVCGMALWGLIVASVVNLFLKSSGLDWIVTFAGVMIFTGLTMYDAQKIKQMAATENVIGAEDVRRVAILGALKLYLDFVNLFLYLLRLLGNKGKR